MEGIINELERVLNSLAVFAPRAVVGLFIFLLVWFLSIVIKKTIRLIGGGILPTKREAITLIAKIIKGTLIILGVVMALSKMGINVTALVAGLGLTGFALGFALRDVLSNILSGALILIYRPFERSDRITVTGFEGTVVDIDLRYTTLQAEGKKILIPNSTLFTNSITVMKECK